MLLFLFLCLGSPDSFLFLRQAIPTMANDTRNVTMVSFNPSWDLLLRPDSGSIDHERVSGAWDAFGYRFCRWGGGLRRPLLSGGWRFLIEWLSPAAALLWRRVKYLHRSDIDDWCQVLCHDSRYEVWAVFVSESFDDVERRPRVARERDEWLRTKSRTAEVDVPLFALSSGASNLCRAAGQFWPF